MALEVRSLSDSLGAEVRGVDASTPLEPRVQAALLEIWRAHYMILLRDQKIDAASQMRFVSYFGALADESRDGGGASYVSNTRSDGFGADPELFFHSDLAFTHQPLQAISRYPLELPVRGGATVFANAAAAAKTLPDDLRTRCQGLLARHVFDLIGQRQDMRHRLEAAPNAAHASHPVLWRHPDTAEPILYVSQMQTDCILELPDEESEALLEELLAHLYRPEHLYEHSWEFGDLLVWDNRALQHARRPFDDTQPRTLRRTIAGLTVVRAYDQRSG